jgi:hypothetical protein
LSTTLNQFTMSNVKQSLKTINSKLDSVLEYCVVMDKTLLVHKLKEVENEIALLEVQLQNN